MLIGKLKTVGTLMLLVALAGVGAFALAVQAAAQKSAGIEPPAARSSPTSTEGLKSVAALVSKVSQDGKTFTLEVPAEVRGEEPKRTEIRITEKTEVVYNGVGLNAAKPTEGHHAHVWLAPGTTDTAAKVVFTVVDATRQGRSFVSGKVVAVSEDRKRITLELPQGRDPEPKRIDFTLSEKTTLTYAYVVKDAAKPSVGYQADLWLEVGTRDAPVIEGSVAKVHFVDVAREKEALRAGKVVGVAKDGAKITLEVPSPVRGENPTRVEVKITPTTEFAFQGVGPNEAAVTEGYGARVWLQEGTTDTAARAVLFKANERGR